MPSARLELLPVPDERPASDLLLNPSQHVAIGMPVALWPDETSLLDRVQIGLVELLNKRRLYEPAIKGFARAVGAAPHRRAPPAVKADIRPSLWPRRRQEGQGHNRRWPHRAEGRSCCPPARKNFDGQIIVADGKDREPVAEP